jgi:hypothetical protein
MNKYDFAGLLRTYAEKCIKSETDKQLKEIIRGLKDALKEMME